jgi:hypothetical protein
MYLDHFSSKYGTDFITVQRVLHGAVNIAKFEIELFKEMGCVIFKDWKSKNLLSQTSASSIDIVPLCGLITTLSDMVTSSNELVKRSYQKIENLENTVTNLLHEVNELNYDR